MWYYILQVHMWYYILQVYIIYDTIYYRYIYIYDTIYYRYIYDHTIHYPISIVVDPADSKTFNELDTSRHQTRYSLTAQNTEFISSYRVGNEFFSVGDTLQRVYI